MSDLHDSSVDYLQQIGALIDAAQGIKNAYGCTYDAWEVDESQLKLIRHVQSSRQSKETLDPRIEASRTLPAPVSRLTGERVTYKMLDE